MRSRWQAGRWGLVVALLVACGGERAPGSEPPPAPTKDSPAPAAETVLLIGTSLTAGYGLDPAQAWPTLLQAKADEAGLRFQIVNAGLSGETSAGALRRLDWLLERQAPAAVMVETGANDGLRGQSVDSLEANLEAILSRLEDLRPRPVLIVAGMEALPNLGAAYTNRFRELYPRLARRHGAIYLPFLLDGVAGIARFNQADGIHPNPEGSIRVADNVWRVLRPVLDSLAADGR